MYIKVQKLNEEISILSRALVSTPPKFYTNFAAILGHQNEWYRPVAWPAGLEERLCGHRGKSRHGWDPSLWRQRVPWVDQLTQFPTTESSARVRRLEDGTWVQQSRAHWAWVEEALSHLAASRPVKSSQAAEGGQSNSFELLRGARDSILRAKLGGGEGYTIIGGLAQEDAISSQCRARGSLGSGARETVTSRESSRTVVKLLARTISDLIVQQHNADEQDFAGEQQQPFRP